MFQEPEKLYLMNTVMGPFAEVRRTDGVRDFFHLSRSWVPATNRRGLFKAVCEEIRTQQPLHFDAGELTPRITPPCELPQSIVGCGVTYWKSQAARNKEFWASVFGRDLSEEEFVQLQALPFMREFKTPYDVVGDRNNPLEVFFKGIPAHAVTHGGTFHFRGPLRLKNGLIIPALDWPEPELCLFITEGGGIEGLLIGDDQTSAHWEKFSALLLGRAKIHSGAPVLSPVMCVPNPAAGPIGPIDLHMTIERRGMQIYDETTSTKEMGRPMEELAEAVHEMGRWPGGVISYTGTNQVPKPPFTFHDGDVLCIESNTLELSVRVTAKKLAFSPREASSVQFDQSAV